VKESEDGQTLLRRLVLVHRVADEALAEELRPGMLAHGLQDALGGLVSFFSKS
jgi:hypothetical protein